MRNKQWQRSRINKSKRSLGRKGNLDMQWEKNCQIKKNTKCVEEKRNKTAKDLREWEQGFRNEITEG